MQDKEVNQFIEQESFLNYCTNRNEQDVRYWQQWLQEHPEHAQQVENMRQLVLLMAEEARTKEIQQNYAALQHRINGGRGKIIHLWPRIAVAASIAILLTTGSYFLVHRQPASPATAIQPGVFRNDVSPGNKAILTLANGQQLTVAAIPAGQVSNTSARKNEDGTLVYAKSNSAPDVYNTLTVPNGGGKHELKLADGTLVVLDAGSSIRFPVAFNGNERRVTVTGQVYFEVAHDVKKPFFVSVFGQTIEDIGTHFNINSFDSIISTTLLEGSIKVGQVILKPGQQAIQTINGQLSVSGTVDEEAVMAWKNDLFKFNHTDLHSVMNQLARWYDVDVTYEGPEKPYHFGGYLPRDGKLTSILKILELNGVKFSLDGRKLIVYR